MPCICDTMPRGYKGFVADETQHPFKGHTRHLHIRRRGTNLYRVEWGTNKRNELVFVNVESGKEADKQFVKNIERWVNLKYLELNHAHDQVLDGEQPDKVDWEN